jgi:hypothetical protein
MRERLLLFRVERRLKALSSACGLARAFGEVGSSTFLTVTVGLGAEMYGSSMPESWAAEDGLEDDDDCPWEVVQTGGRACFDLVFSWIGLTGVLI